MGRCPRARQRIPPRELAVLQRWWRALRRSTAQITSLPVPESLMVATPPEMRQIFHNPLSKQ